MAKARQRVPASEIQLAFARSSGAGGQNVNKVSTKVVARWAIGRSSVFSWEEKDRLRRKLANRLNVADELVVASQAERTQGQNRAYALARLQELVERALRVPNIRRPARPTKASRLKRVAGKKFRSKLKQTRQGRWQ